MTALVTEVYLLLYMAACTDYSDVDMVSGKKQAPVTRTSLIPTPVLVGICVLLVMIAVKEFDAFPSGVVYPHAPVQVSSPYDATTTEYAEEARSVTEEEVMSNEPAPPTVAVEPTPAKSIATPTSTPTPAPIQAGNFSVGISMGETLSYVSQTKLDATLDDIASLGIDWIRVDCSWKTIQPHDRSYYSWDAFDRIVKSAHERGIRVLPILTYTPEWARAEECTYTSKCHPKNAEEFATFARAAAERYTPMGVTTWEIWNEPNMGIFWAPHADPELYVELLMYTYEAIKDVAPNATVVSGGLAPVDSKGINMSALDFTERMYLDGAKEYFDALGYHPYTYPASPSTYDKLSGWSQMYETTQSLRGIMKYNDDGEKKIWLTEYGAPTNGPGPSAHDDDYVRWRVPSHVTESYQAELLRIAIEQAQDLDFVGPLFWYSYQDLGTDEQDRENFFGLRRYDGSVKPSYSMIQLLIYRGI